jgi:hypothetical protein
LTQLERRPQKKRDVDLKNKIKIEGTPPNKIKWKTTSEKWKTTTNTS